MNTSSTFKRVWISILILGALLLFLTISDAKATVATEDEIMGNPVRPLAVTDVAQGGPTFTVNADDDVNDSQCGTTHCSLREAILAANAKANGASPDAIHFDLS
ncbi:MAG: CSLREA domain-containing protein, partial [Chloroflexi bacterium]|nr:CSLREA domain-containing protein [Chloroflexota bacterium]